jgi:hypothetical protein
MSTLECPHCHATNRRPVCGRCRTELSEPREVKLAWYVSQRRRQAGAAAVSVLATLVLWQIWQASDEPRNLVDCQEKAARTARSNAAMHVLLAGCSARFR